MMNLEYDGNVVELDSKTWDLGSRSKDFKILKRLWKAWKDLKRLWKAWKDLKRLEIRLKVIVWKIWQRAEKNWRLDYDLIMTW